MMAVASAMKTVLKGALANVVLTMYRPVDVAGCEMGIGVGAAICKPASFAVVNSHARRKQRSIDCCFPSKLDTIPIRQLSPSCIDVGFLLNGFQTIEIEDLPNAIADWIVHPRPFLKRSDSDDFAKRRGAKRLIFFITLESRTTVLSLAHTLSLIA
jgi:hypothetical protein